jgi:hypothetical protein
MAIEGLAADAQFSAQIGDDGAALAHGSLCEAQFCRRHLRLAATAAAAGTGRPNEPSKRKIHPTARGNGSAGTRRRGEGTMLNALILLKV